MKFLNEINEIHSVSKAIQQLLYHQEETSLHPPQSFSKQLSGTKLPPPAPYDLEILSHELAYFGCIDQRAERIKTDRMSFTINIRVNVESGSKDGNSGGGDLGGQSTSSHPQFI